MSQSFRYRTLWLSDIHLGSRACRIDLLLDFLRRHRCERLYLADGRRLLVLHGDEFDSALRCNALASLIGCAGYGLLLGLNRLTHGVNALLRRPYWSLAQAVKMRIGKAARYVARFQEACLDAARDAGLDGVVCGHIHRADLIERKGLVYCNDGDWVESCTALAEDDRGRLALIQWGQSAVTVDEALPEPLRDAA